MQYMDLKFGSIQKSMDAFIRGAHVERYFIAKGVCEEVDEAFNIKEKSEEV